jgi:hypothetical protein
MVKMNLFKLYLCHNNINPLLKWEMGITPSGGITSTGNKVDRVFQVPYDILSSMT